MSVYEGFGMPVVEGLACGVPVLTSLNTVMEEVAGECAFYADPFDVEAISAQLETALTDETRRTRFGQNGPLQAAKFDWQRSADTLFKTLHDVC
jgi:glycosyltransferase involved in cell wall biosynthesis